METTPKAVALILQNFFKNLTYDLLIHPPPPQRYWLLALIAIAFWACQKDIPIEENPKQVNNSLEDPFAEVPRLKNPYSVENMKKALESLKTQKGNDYSAARIYATHYYIKFTPRDEREYDILKTDSLLDLYKYPLDIEEWIIPQIGALSAQSERPPTMWCAVKVDHTLPEGCPYEILEHLYIPDEYKIDEHGKSSSQQHAFAEALVDESMRLTGNVDKTSSNEKTARGGRWRPAGKIKSWDDHIGVSRSIIGHETYTENDYSTCWDSDPNTPCPLVVTKQRPVYGEIQGSLVGVEGVIVRARRWFTTHRGTVDAIGKLLL